MSQIIRKQLENGDIIYFSLVNKDSQRGFSTNQRLFLMMENHFICYLSSPKLDFPYTNQYIAKNAKMVIPLRQVTKVTNKQQERKITISFWIFQKNKKIEKNWILTMNSRQLYCGWVDLFDQFSNRSRNNTRDKKSSRTQSNDNKQIEQSRRYSKPKILVKQQSFTPQLKSMQNQQKNQRPQSFVEIVDESLFKTNNVETNNVEAILKQQIEQKKRKEQERLIKIQLSKIKQRSKYFNAAQMEQNENFNENFNFRNYYRPYIDEILSNKNKIIKSNQLKNANRKFSKFIDHSIRQVRILIDEKLNQSINQNQGNKLKIREEYFSNSKYDHSQSIKHKLDDITIEYSMIELRQISQNNYICDNSLSKIRMNEFKNMDYLFEIIQKDQKLSNTFLLPMQCVVIYKGFTCFVTSNINPVEDGAYQSKDQKSDVSEMFERLAKMAKISFDYLQNQKCIKFVHANSNKTKFIIMYSVNLLPSLQRQINVRKEAFQNIYTNASNQVHEFKGNRKQNEAQMQSIKQYIEANIKKLSILMDKLEIYPMIPADFGKIFHEYGINIKYLGKLYNSVNQVYIKSLIKSEAAARMFKIIFEKKLQENILKSTAETDQVALKLLNILFGNSQDSMTLWKVISMHTQTFYNLTVEQKDITKGYFLLAIQYYLNMEIRNEFLIEQIFKKIDTVKQIIFSHKVKYPMVLPSFLTEILQESQIANYKQLITKLTLHFDLESKQIPSFIKCHKDIYHKILYWFSFDIKPNDNKLKHLALYENNPNQNQKFLEYFLDYCHKKLNHIKWQIKVQGKKQLVLDMINKQKEQIRGKFGYYHPFISQIDELLAQYYLSIQDHQKSISSNKQSLSNMIQCCNNPKHIKISGSYYQMGQSYLCWGKIEQAISNFKKAKNILEVNQYKNEPEYAVLLKKLASLFLFQQKDIQSYQLLIHAIYIYEHKSVENYWDQLVELYETIQRCDFNHKQYRPHIELQNFKLAQHCISQLQYILSIQVEFQICTDHQFIRLIRIIFQQIIKKMRKQAKKLYRPYIIQLCDAQSLNLDSNFSDRSQSIIFFKQKIQEGTFSLLFNNYITDTFQILSKIQEIPKITHFISQKSIIYQNYETFMKHFVAILGESFLYKIL